MSVRVFLCPAAGAICPFAAAPPAWAAAPTAPGTSALTLLIVGVGVAIWLATRIAR